MKTNKGYLNLRKHNIRFFSYILLLLLTTNVNSQAYPHPILQETNLEIPRLSPIPTAVQNIKKPVISLNGTWQVALNNNTPIPIEVPGELVMQGHELNIGETAYYQRNIEIPKEWQHKRIFIKFDAVSSYAHVKLNGIPIVEHEGSFVPFEAEITNQIKAGNNLIEVAVRANTISDVLGCTSQYAAHTVAGILRKVRLFVLPESNIADITITTTFDKKFQNAKLQIETKIDLLNTDISDLQLRYTLIDAKGKQKLHKRLALESTSKDHKNYIISDEIFNINNPNHWNPENPYLYQLQTELVKNEEILQKNVQNIGFRQIDIKKGEVFVNGHPIKLHGVNRHAVHPLTGRSLTPEFERLDAKLFKEANCNYIRTSHYPPSEEFLEAADRLGLFVESEASLTWIQHHASPIWGHWNYQNEKFLPYMLMANIENIQANKKHPSIILWSLANESRWSPLWDKVKQFVKFMDPSRPNAFHDQCWGGFNNAGSTADIANYHYPGINGPAATDTMSRPTLFGEYAHLSTYNRRELLTDPGVRDAYNQPLVAFYDSIYVHQNNLGGAIWSGIDDTFHLPNGKIVGYGPWGPLDGWRRPKPEYFGVKKAYSPVKILNKNLSGKKIQLQVENRYDFTSLQDITIIAEINGKEYEIKSNIPPRKQGIITIPSKTKINTLKMTFYDPLGFIAEEEYYDFTEKVLIENSKTKALSYEENQDSYHILQGDIRYRVSKLTGAIKSIVNDGQTIIKEGPLFSVVPMNSEDGGKNNIAGETYQRNISPLQNFPWFMKYATNIEIKKSQEAIKMIIDVTFKEGKGVMEYTFDTNGYFNARYTISEISKQESPYQYGLVLILPKSFDRLAWKRKGDFTLYPDDHIGRNEGSAKLNAVSTKGVAPWRIKPLHSWKDDANELGSNDFRSTKRNILYASLSNEKGSKITVLSKGDQSSRTWLQEEHIHWLISDYSNKGSEPFYGTPHSEGRVSIKDKVLTGEITLIFD
ncbi:beta-galactosidase [Arenibacter sp. 6A1]|uniref:glycoside hydrolase family 2 protein n=1 Tax=Arenibacter sp. 6A1 TaxID=2720391 RepID=UPI00144654B8|nr:glycoside hydrolase family 2 TIM barrel-domain containing protein [Arenibacter sp. 6A1]NKI27569.1 beta-galactosidase [Arenibacter sp. 6A1]